MQKRIAKGHLDQLFVPRTLALIGATSNVSKWGGIILANILTNKYKGTVYPVSLREREIFGVRAYPSVRRIPGPVDLACIVTPASTVHGIIRECAQKGIRTVLVISSGFSEMGQGGRKREEELREEAHSLGIRLAGPNSLGVYSASMSLVCMMALMEPLGGSISLVSQSGNIGVQMMTLGKMLKAGFRQFISSGNEGDISCEEYLHYFGEDPGCRAAMVYVESLNAGRSFFEIAQQVSRRKPVIIFKGGKTQAGKRAAASHTGALAGKSSVVHGAFRQAGVIHATTTEEFIDCARSFSRVPLPAGNRVGIITRGGGWGVITADACEKLGLVVPHLHPKTMEALDRLLPPYWSRGNPVDLVAVGNIEGFLDCGRLLIQDPNVDGVIALSMFPERIASFLRNPDVKAVTGIDDSLAKEQEDSFLEVCARILDGMVHHMRELRKPVLMVSGGQQSPRVNALLEKHGVCSYPTPERAVQVMGRLVEYAAYRRRIEGYA